MPIQAEQKIFPHVVPPLPERSGNLKEDVDALYSWIFDQQKALDELNRQVVDKYNAHIDQTHAHPKAWERFRLRRPRYYNATDGGTTVTVPATSDIPAMFVIDGELFEITSDLTCDLSGSGAGGLDTGSVAANTPYYLYGIRNSSTVALIASVTAPSTGPTSYTGAFTYIGAFATESGAATLPAFTSVNGTLLCESDIEGESHSSASRNQETYTAMPVTVRHGFFKLQVSGGSTGDDSLFGGTSVVGEGILVEEGGGSARRVYGWIPILTSQSIWIELENAATTALAGLRGWREDPTEYQ